MQKYIIIGGCSYSNKSIKSIKSIIGDPNIEIIEIGTPASSNKYISDSIIFLVDELLTNKILSKNILVINNFTQIGRENPIVPNELTNKIEESLELKNEKKYFNFTYSFYESFVKIKSRIYYLMNNSSDLPKSISSWTNSVEEMYKKKNPIYFFENYLSDIIFLQNFCKIKNVTCVSYMMNNVFEGWYDDFSHVYNKNKKWELPSMKNTNHISEMSELTKVFWKMINLNDIVFYKTNTNKYGGIDEYFIDKFSDIKYLENTPLDDYTWFSNHPNETVYEKFTIALLKNKILEWKELNT